MALPELKIKSEGRTKDPLSGKHTKFRIGKYVTLQQSTYKDKMFILQEIFFPNGGQEIRFGYYIIGKKPGRKGKWVWGQYAPFIPKKDLRVLFEKARRAKIL